MKTTFAIAFLTLALAVSGLAANVYGEGPQGRAHSATGAFGCTVNAASVATPSVIGCTTAHNLVTGDQLQITGIVGTTTDNTLAYALVLTSTTFSIWSDAATTASPIAGVGVYSSGGKVSIAKDISLLSGDFTVHIGINGTTANLHALVCVQDSADGFVSDIVTLWCVNVTGGNSQGFYIPPIGYSKRAYEVPSARIGVANARMRLNVQSLDNGATVTTVWFIEQ